MPEKGAPVVTTTEKNKTEIATKEAQNFINAIVLGLQAQFSARFDALDTKLAGIETRLAVVENLVEGLPEYKTRITRSFTTIKEAASVENKTTSDKLVAMESKVAEELEKFKKEINDKLAKLRLTWE